MKIFKYVFIALGIAVVFVFMPLLLVPTLLALLAIGAHKGSKDAELSQKSEEVPNEPKVQSGWIHRFLKWITRKKLNFDWNRVLAGSMLFFPWIGLSILIAMVIGPVGVTGLIVCICFTLDTMFGDDPYFNIYQQT